MDVWMKVGNKFCNVENDLRSVSRQFALLQEFIRLKFQAEFNAFVEAAEAEEDSGCNAFSNVDTEAATATASNTQEMYHHEKNENSSTQMNFIAPSVSVRKVRATPLSINKPMSSSTNMISSISSGGSVDAYYQSGETVSENIQEQTHYNTNSRGFEAEDAHEFLPTELEPPEIIDQKFEPPQDVVGLDDDGVEDSLDLGTSTRFRRPGDGYERYEHLESSTSRQTARRITSIRSRGRSSRKECWKCHKTFKTSYHLSRHEISHLSIKPFKCPGCPKRFARKDNMKVHFKMTCSKTSSALTDELT